MIYITGDTHRNYHFDKLLKFSQEHPELTKEDYLIIAGDFGGVFSQDTLEDDLQHYSDLPFTVLFVDGNHENFDILNAYPVEEWNGGKIHRIRNDIIHLMRGQVFEIEGKTFFTFGGAMSQDRESRVEGIGWWKEELPTHEEYEEAVRNLSRYGNKVDYVVTHSCSERALYYKDLRDIVIGKPLAPEVALLSGLDEIITCKRWYFGHFHIDTNLGSRYTCLMHQVVEIGREVAVNELQ